MSNNHKRAVIWDLDGTLINSVEHHWQAWRAVMAAENFEFSFEQFTSDFGKRNDEILRGYFGEQLTPSEIERIALAKETQYRQAVKTIGLDLLPGARHWLEALKEQGWLQALGTSAPRGNIDAIFEVLGIEQFFDAVVSSEEVKQGKPAPDVFLRAAEMLKVSPEVCIVVEDAPAGIEAARRAGMRNIGVLTTHSSLQADLVVETLDRIPSDY
ncbi:MAG TPA: HAD family phosphatase, partial [Blastocatellia bacterium]|nr:HAD family phosphatase [Blastocatellia bacterium]